MTTKWFKDYDACLECGSTKIPHHGHGLCNNCYARWVRRQNPEKDKERNRKHEKTEKRKTWIEQYKKTERYKQNVIRWTKKAREKNRELYLSRTRKWRDKNRGKIKEYNDASRNVKWLRRYGEDALRILMENNYKCQKCGSDKRVGIHHIDWDEADNVYENFAVFCGSCHSSVHRWIPERLRKQIFEEWLSLPLEETSGKNRYKRS